MKSFKQYINEETGMKDGDDIEVSQCIGLYIKDSKVRYDLLRSLNSDGIDKEIDLNKERNKILDALKRNKERDKKGTKTIEKKLNEKDPKKLHKNITQIYQLAGGLAEYLRGFPDYKFDYVILKSIKTFRDKLKEISGGSVTKTSTADIIVMTKDVNEFKAKLKDIGSIEQVKTNERGVCSIGGIDFMLISLKGSSKSQLGAVKRQFDKEVGIETKPSELAKKYDPKRNNGIQTESWLSDKFTDIKNNLKSAKKKVSSYIKEKFQVLKNYLQKFSKAMIGSLSKQVNNSSKVKKDVNDLIKIISKGNRNIKEDKKTAESLKSWGREEIEECHNYIHKKKNQIESITNNSKNIKSNIRLMGKFTDTNIGDFTTKTNFKLLMELLYTNVFMDYILIQLNSTKNNMKKLSDQLLTIITSMHFGDPDVFTLPLHKVFGLETNGSINVNTKLLGTPQEFINNHKIQGRIGNIILAGVEIYPKGNNNVKISDGSKLSYQINMYYCSGVENGSVEYTRIEMRPQPSNGGIGLKFDGKEVWSLKEFEKIFSGV